MGGGEALSPPRLTISQQKPLSWPLVLLSGSAIRPDWCWINAILECRVVPGKEAGWIGSQNIREGSLVVQIEEVRERRVAVGAIKGVGVGVKWRGDRAHPKDVLGERQNAAKVQ